MEPTKTKWTIFLLSITTLLTNLGCLATIIYLIQMLNGSHKDHQTDLLALITGKAYESPQPTKTTLSETPKHEPPNPLDVLMTQFDGLPQDAQEAAIREYQEHMTEQGMWKEPDSRVPQVTPGEPIDLQWSEPPSST